MLAASYLIEVRKNTNLHRRRKTLNVVRNLMDSWDSILQQQKEICKGLQAKWVPVDKNSLIGFNESIFSSRQPVNGLRHPKHGQIDGWYLWSGEEIPQSDDNFFQPIYVKHLIEKRPLVLKYLGLPPGWRFQIDDSGYEDIWFDKAILDI